MQPIAPRPQSTVDSSKARPETPARAHADFGVAKTGRHAPEKLARRVRKHQAYGVAKRGGRSILPVTETDLAD